MKKILALLALSSALLFGQNPNTAAFPTAAAADTDLFVANNGNGGTALNGSITNVATTIVLTSGTRFVAPVIISIEGEIIHCTTLTTNTLSACSRGQEGTSAAAHSSGVIAYALQTGWFHNQVAAEIKAVETGLAANNLGYATGGGTADSQTVSLAPPVGSLTNGLKVCWKPTAANSTTTPTLAVNGLTAKTIVKAGGAALVANDLTTTAVACAIYDGTSLELQNPQTANGFMLPPVAYASIPSASMAGRSQLFNDSPFVAYDTGSAWTYFLPGMIMGKVTPPVLANFTWVNQSSVTSDTTHGGVGLINPTVQNAFNIHALMKAAPATPYHVIVCWRSNYETGQTNGIVGAAFSDGTNASTSKFMIFGNYQGSYTQFVTFYASNSTTYGNSTVVNVTGLQAYISPIRCVRIGDDGTGTGTARTYDISSDGYNWQNLGSDSRTSQFTATQVGLVINDGATSIQFVHYAETN